MNAPILPNFDQRVAQYVKLRDKIKELDDKHKEQMKPYREALEQLNGALLNHLNNVGADSVASPSGTVYRTEKKSASIADKTAFWTYVVTTANFDLIDYKANVTAVADHIDQNQQPPPGVNFTSRFEVGVRRK